MFQPNPELRFDRLAAKLIVSAIGLALLLLATSLMKGRTVDNHSPREPPPIWDSSATDLRNR